jgi:hypothetical protein
MQEALLYNYWEYYYNAGQTLYWANSALKILEAGVLNEHNGPDFRFARFKLNDTIYQGAVEFHINIEDWYKHKHQFDPAYQDVVLHVVANPPAKTKEVRHLLSGRAIPTFVLPKPPSSGHKINCISAKKQSKNETVKVLQNMALQRLNLKVRSFSKRLKSLSEHSLFYQEFFRILGYPFNKNPFTMLALKVPQQFYETHKNKTLLLQAVYLGYAGFLQGSFNDSYARQLQKLFLYNASLLSASLLNLNDWHLSANRPLNHPQFRLAAWVAFLASIQNQTPFSLITQLMTERSGYQHTYNRLHKIFSLKPDGYWHKHYALDKPLKQSKTRVYLGHERIDEILTNLVIPLSISKANKNNNPGFVSYLQDFYLWMPGKCNYASLLRKRPWFNEYKKIWLSCNTGQALHYLNDVYCSRSQCSRCPLGRKKLT